MRVIVKFFRLSAVEQRRVILALIYLVITHASLRVFGFNRCHRFLDRRAKRIKFHGGTPAVEPLVTAVQRAANAVPIGKCLARSMALRGFLQRYGIDAQVRIGVSRNGELLDAHAWVEYRGNALGERVAEKYAAFPAPH